MGLISTLSVITILLSALYLLALGAASLLAPARTGRFLQGFAGGPAVHYVELLLRIVVGAAFVQFAPNMLFASVFTLFGWTLLITTVFLIVLPWRWHRRFAQRVIPDAIQFLALVGMVSLSLGAVVIYAVIHGQAI